MSAGFGDFWPPPERLPDPQPYQSTRCPLIVNQRIAEALREVLGDLTPEILVSEPVPLAELRELLPAKPLPRRTPQWRRQQARIQGYDSRRIAAADDFRAEVSSDLAGHEIKAVRMVRDNETAWCRCGAVLPVERDGAEIGEAVSRSLRQHLAEVARGAAEGRQDG